MHLIQNGAFTRIAYFGYTLPMKKFDEPVVRKTVALSEAVWNEVEEWQYAHRVKRDADAIRRLIILGLAASALPAPPNTAKKTHRKS
jgi:hypothetical protein